MKLDFVSNKTIGIGVELEVQLVDHKTGDLKPVAPMILRKLRRELDSEYIKSELFQSMLEIETPICQNAEETGRSLRSSLALLRKVSTHFGVDVLMAGTHPFAKYTDRLLTPENRYFQLVDRNRWITRRLQIFGLHIHLGMRDGSHAIAMNNALSKYLPMLLALSASSPFWQGDDTGLASSRITFFEAIPTGGHAYRLRDWEDYENLVESLIHSKSIETPKDLWWDIRPNADYGTLEIRIADCPPTIREVEAIVAFIHCLALWIDTDLASGKKIPSSAEWITRENKWRAARHGVDCELIVNSTGDSSPLLFVWKDLREKLTPFCRKLGYEQFFDFLENVIVNGPSYVRQRQHLSTGFQGVIHHLIEEGEQDRPAWSP